MTSAVTICNGALLRLGAANIVSLSQNSVNARACSTTYDQTLQSELRARAWSFAIKRAVLPASATPLIYGFGQAFPLPSDFLRLLHPDLYGVFLANPAAAYASSLGSMVPYCDWAIEGANIVTVNTAPISIRYISLVEDPTQWDPLFSDVMSAKLAVNLCELLTQSNSKKMAAAQDYKDAIAEATKLNAFEQPSQLPQEDIYVTIRG